MKRVKTETIFLAITMLFVAFCAGFFLGRGQRTETITITTGAPIAVSKEPKATEGTQPPSDSAAPTEETKAVTTQTLETGININTATKEELMLLPGIGEVYAERIIAYRQKNGPFATIEELDGVSGIGEKRLDAIRDYITVEEQHEDSGS